jgi:DNA-binding IclR family transcriptional regulator
MRALQRVIGILETVAEVREPATASVVAERLSLSLSTTARLMRTLSDEELLERNGAGYTLGTRFLALLSTARQPDTLSEIALPAMQTLRDQTGETVSLHVRRADQRVCVGVAESEQAVRRVVPAGFSVPLHQGATGEVLLAGLTDLELEQYVETLQLSPKHTRELLRRVSSTRAEGWSIGIERWLSGLSGIATGVFRQSELVAAMTVSGPASRWDEAAMRRHLPALLAAAQETARHLGPTTRISG